MADVALSWAAPISGFPGGAQLFVYRSSAPIDISAPPSAIAALAGTARSYVDPGRSPGETLFYRVAVENAGLVAFSAEASITLSGGASGWGVAWGGAWG